MVNLKGLGGEELNGFMDQGTEVVGELRFRETFRVDGRLKGKIFSEKTVIIGETAQVEADIECGVVSIRGTVTGSVQGREKIEKAGGKVQVNERKAHRAKFVAKDGKKRTPGTPRTRRASGASAGAKKP